MDNEYYIFNRNKLKKHRDRAASKFTDHNSLHKYTSELLGERIECFKGEFENIINIYSSGLLTKYLPKHKLHIESDISYNFAQNIKGNKIVSDEEFLPFANNIADLFLSLLNLHFVNDVPGVLLQINKILKKDGIFLGAMLGGQSLIELKQILLESEMQIRNGASIRISPFIDIKIMGGLLQRSNFKNPVVDSKIIKISYKDIYELMYDLRYSGQSNSLAKSSGPLNKEVLDLADKKYKEQFSDGEGGIYASYEILTITAVK